MNKKIDLIIDGEPQGKARPRFVKATGHTYTPQKTKDYEKAVAWAYKAAGGEMFSGAVRLVIGAYFKIPKRGVQGLLKPLKKPDADNITKIILDGLNGIAYKDDKQVVSLTICKYYGEPRVEVSVEELV